MGFFKIFPLKFKKKMIKIKEKKKEHCCKYGHGKGVFIARCSNKCKIKKNKNVNFNLEIKHFVQKKKKKLIKSEQIFKFHSLKKQKSFYFNFI